MAGWYRKILLLLLVVLLAAGGHRLIQHRRAELADLETPPVRPTVVRTAKVVKGDLPLSRHYLGRIEPVTEAAVSPRAEGHLTSVRMDVGDRVQEGEVIAEIDNRLPRKEKKAIDAELAGAGDELAQRRKELERRKALFAEGHLSEDKLDQSRRIYYLARARVRKLQAELEAAGVSESYTRLLAPFSGTVSERFLEPGDLVRPGQPVYRLESPGAGYRVLVDVSRDILPGLSRGNPVILGNGDRREEAVVDRIHPAVHEGKLATVEIRRSSAPFDLPSGSVIGVDLQHSLTEGWLVPLAAVLEQEKAEYVFTVAAGNLARKHRVTVKGRNRGQAVVEGPLTGGERVITGNEAMLLQLQDGSPVQPLSRMQ